MSRASPLFEAQVLFTHYGEIGSTGRIEDVERFTSSNVCQITDALATYLAKEIVTLWPAGHGAAQLHSKPRRLTFTITMERKEVKRYGK